MHARYQCDEDRITLNVSIDARGCWNWGLSRSRKGYGLLAVGGRTARAHRFSYEVFVGPIPAGLDIDHLCMNRSCVNPQHLEAVEHAVNVHRSPRTQQAINAAKTHCKRGHAFDEANTYLATQDGWPRRVCRQCRNAYGQASKARRAFRAAGMVASA